MFFFSPFDYFDDYGYDSFGPNRRNWADKSQAALRREEEAKRLFDAFLEQCKGRTDFPVTQEIIPATTHLTDACWKSFRAYVKNKGCGHKRREATPDERKGATRRGKMYVISVTVPVHPDQLAQNQQEKQAKATEAAQKKKEREAAKKKKQEEEAILRAQEAAAYKVAVENAYKTVMGLNVETPAAAAAPAAKAKPVQTDDVIKYAETVYKEKRNEIVDAIYQEKRKLEQELSEKMMAKKRRLLDEAEEQHQQNKKTITEKHGVLKSSNN